MRVLLTRAKADAERTAAALARRGHDVVLAPVIVIARADVVWPPGRFDALMATSHRAFHGRETRHDGAIDRRRPVFAVGRRTAEAARAAGYEDVRIGTGDAEGLIGLLRLTLPRPARLLYLAGRDRKPTLEAGLAGAGYAVDAVEAYAAEAVACWPAPVLDGLRDRKIDLALHYSRRSVELALALAEREGLGEAFLRLRHACLSGNAAEPLLARKALSVAVAERPEEDALLALVPADGPARP